MKKTMKYETPEIEFTRFDVATKLMIDDGNDQEVIIPGDDPTSLGDIGVPGDGDFDIP